MDADLTEIALNALDSAEAADEESSSTGADSDTEQGTGTDGAGDTDAGGNEPEKGENDAADDNDEGEKGESENGDDDSTNNSDSGDSGANRSDEKESSDGGEVEKKELTDEEFEEMAKKRGYSKTPTDEEKKQQDDQKKQAEEKAANEKATLERLTRKPAEVPQEVWDDTPQNNKIVYNNLPVITAKGANGQSVNVKLPNQLPRGFRFADETARAEFMAAVQEQTNRMNAMLNALNSRDQRIQAEEERRQESQRVVNEVAALQKSGALPTPTAKYGTKEFNDDPAVAVINNVLNYRIQRAQQGVNLSVADALTLYKSAHPEEFEKKEDTKAKGDEERKSVAKKIAGSKKSTGKSASDKPRGEHRYYQPGMGTQDVLDRVLEDLD